jgi:hypothetical protein
LRRELVANVVVYSARRFKRAGAPSCLALFFFIACAGCGNGRSTVLGTLTLDGKPLGRTATVQVTIMFSPADGSGAPAAALGDESGCYELTTGSQHGLAPGQYIVTLAATEATQGRGGESRKRVLTPLRYANPKETDLRADVQPGRNTFDFNLRSDAQGRS